MRITGGIPVGGNLGSFVAGGPDLPFGGGGRYRTIQEQFRPGSADRQRIPDPIRIFPQNEPGREGAINVKFEQAQLMPGMQPMGNAGALGAMMQMGPKFGPRPLNIDINAVDDRLESIGGSANVQIDPNQMLRFGGSFNPAFNDQTGMQIPQSYSVYGAYETPGFGFNVNYRNTGQQKGGFRPSSVPGGLPGEIQAGFKGKF